MEITYTIRGREIHSITHDIIAQYCNDNYSTGGLKREKEEETYIKLENRKRRRYQRNWGLSWASGDFFDKEEGKSIFHEYIKNILKMHLYKIFYCAYIFILLKVFMCVWRVLFV